MNYVFCLSALFRVPSDLRPCQALPGGCHSVPRAGSHQGCPWSLSPPAPSECWGLGCHICTSHSLALEEKIPPQDFVSEPQILQAFLCATEPPVSGDFIWQQDFLMHALMRNKEKKRGAVIFITILEWFRDAVCVTAVSEATRGYWNQSACAINLF